MVSPVSGPFTLSINRSNYVLFRKWYRQKRPFDQPLAFNFMLRRTIACKDTYSDSIRSGWAPTIDMFSQNLINRTYYRFVDKVKSDTADIGTMIAEFGEAKAMVASRAKDLYLAARYVKKLQPIEALNILLKGNDGRLHRGRNLRPPASIKSKDPASLWLELSFGWLPTYGDILGALTVLASPPATGSISASSKERRRIWLYGGPGSGRYQYVDVEARLRCGAFVQINNPNVTLANQLGLLNPLVIAWEIVPFSFVVDRFLDLKGIMQSYTDFAGLTLTKKYQTFDAHWDEFNWSHYSDGDLEWHYEGHRTDRSLTSFPGPSVTLKPARALAPSEGLNYISLLAQQLRSF